MSYSNSKFKNGEWYRCRGDADGGRWDVSPGENKTPYFEFPALVLGGEMEGERLPVQWYVTEKVKEQFHKRCAVLGFDSRTTDLNELPKFVVGKEFWAKCEISEKAGGRGYYPARASEVASLTDRVVGGPAFKAATILGNTGTKQPEADAYADNF